MQVEDDSFLQKVFIKIYGRPLILKRIHIIFIIIVIIYQILIQFTNLITLVLTGAQVYPVTPAVFNATINSTTFGVSRVIVYNLDNYFYAVCCYYLLKKTNKLYFKDLLCFLFNM